MARKVYQLSNTEVERVQEIDDLTNSGANEAMAKVAGIVANKTVGGEGSYTLPTATDLVLGGVKIGAGVTITNGVISVSTDYAASNHDHSGVYATATHASQHAVGGGDAIFPADPGADKYLKWNNTSNLIEWADASGGAGDMILNGIQSVTGLKTFDKDKVAMKGTSTGTNIISVANTSATSYTNILPAKDGTFAMTVDIPSITGLAQKALDNLASVAINTSLISDTDITDDLGTGDIRWRDIHAATLNAGLTATDTLKLRGRDVDGAAYVDILTITSANTVLADLNAIVTRAGGKVILDADHTALTTGIHGLAITAGQTLTVTAGGTLGTAAYTAATAYAAALSGTQNEIAYFNTTTTIASLAVATYPSLTELSYVKGVSSAIQTQLNAKGVGDMTLAGIQSVTGLKTFDTTKLAVKGSSTGTTAIASANAGATGYTQTLQARDGTIANLDNVTYIGTTSVALNRSSAALTLAGITLTTPDIGTPSAGVATNITGLVPGNIIAGTLAAKINLGEGADPATIGLEIDGAMSADERYSGITVPGTAGATLAFGDLCYLDVTATEWLLADASAAATAGDVVLGICVDASTDGNATSMLLMGTVRSAAFPASIALGAPVYISETAGDITATQPTTTDAVIRRLGFAITAEPNTIFFSPSTDYATHV